MKREEFDLVIEDVGARGDGVGFRNGKPVYVPRALAGETVRVRLGVARDTGFSADLLGVSAPSPERVVPPCPVYGSCGGCAFQHWQPQPLAEWKLSLALGLLEKAGVAPAQMLPSALIPAATRRRVTMAALRRGRQVRLGYNRARSHEITDAPGCLILTPRLQSAAGGIRPFLPALLREGKQVDIFLQDTGQVIDMVMTGPLDGDARGLSLAAREACLAMMEAAGIARLHTRAREKDAPELVFQRAPVFKRAGKLDIPVPPGGFLQPSAEGEAALVEAVLRPLKDRRISKVADLFCGSGTFAGPLLAIGAVHAVESDREAVAALQKAAAGEGRLSAERRDLFAAPLPETELNGFDAVIMDPPRAGAPAQALRLAASRVKLIVSISCNAASFARDARIFAGGGYRLQSLQMIDQFAWSPHLELAGVFSRD